MNQALHHELIQEPAQPVRLNLLSTQQGIFLADHLSAVEDLYTIAHCLELPKTLDIATFKQAIQLGLREADTVRRSIPATLRSRFYSLKIRLKFRLKNLIFVIFHPSRPKIVCGTGCRPIANMPSH